MFKIQDTTFSIGRAGWRGWFVTGLLYPGLRVRPRPKSVDFHDAENRQWPCRRSLECLFSLDTLDKIKNSSIDSQSSELRCLPLGRKLSFKITCSDYCPPIRCRTKKRYQLPGNVY
ncbi:hypothetical protein TNCV_3953231 [Trichonephila clavipes]|nr:hypothetical protein TNCV_3953231 [Trichonephila clavipes]